MDIRENFYLKSDKFFKEGLFNEISSNEKFSLCNIANSCYGAFDFNVCNELKEPLGYLIEPKYLEAIMKDSNNLYVLLDSLSQEERKNLMINCNEQVYNMMKEMKKNTDINGPAISLEYEKMLIEKYVNNGKVL